MNYATFVWTRVGTLLVGIKDVAALCVGHVLPIGSTQRTAAPSAAVKISHYHYELPKAQSI